MKLKSLRVLLPAFCLLALPLSAANTLQLGNATAEFGTVANVQLTLTTTDEVQGLVATFDWDSAAGTGEGLTPGAAIATADTIVSRVEDGYIVLGVVMDSDGADSEIILPGENLVLGTAQIRCGNGPEESTTPITFRDGTYNTVDGGPVLDNIVVVGGLSIGAAEGLEMVSGSFRCIPTPPKFFIEMPGGENPSTEGRTGSANVMMQNLADVEGYVVALCHDGADLTLDAIGIGAAANAVGAEFSAADVSGSNGGTLGVVLDFQPPFDGQTIAPGANNNIAVYNYTCNNPPARGEPAVVTPLTFCDNVLGSPLKENVIVVGGLSIAEAEGLLLVDGAFECRAPDVPPPAENCNNGIDDDGDGAIDAEDSDCQQAFRCDPAGDGQIGGSVKVDLLIRTTEDGAVGEHAQFDHIQGFSMAIRYCCALELIDQNLDISGTILEAIGAEFVSVQADNDDVKVDTDGCEVIVGVLVDALPPFDGATIPPLPDFQRVGTLTFQVKDDQALCGVVCPIEFVDGLNGKGKVPVKNLIAVENVSRSVVTESCEVEIVDTARFYRGDCNFSDMGGMSVDISDAAAVVSFLFMQGTWKFNPPCLDACDCNDDGRIDLADAICVLQYYLQAGEFPPAPGPGWAMSGDGVVETPPGVDPSDDKLGCDGGTTCAN